MQKTIKELELLIIGAGAAGLSAGIYAAMLKVDTLILEDQLIGGQILDAYSVENYPGFISTTGAELMDIMHQQAEKQGAKVDEFDTIISVKLTDNEKIVETDSYIYKPKAVIIAAGMKRRTLPLPEETKFKSKGVHYCELCDGHLYEGKKIVVVGGGRAGVGAAISLTRYAQEIILIHHRDTLQAEAKVIDQLLANPKIKVMYNTEIVTLQGDKHLEQVVVENNQTKEQTTLEVPGMFVFIGWIPRTDMYAPYLDLDSQGNIIAGEDCQTKVAGVFVAGDVRSKKIRQLTTAVSDGTVAALNAEEYLGELKNSK